MQATLATTLLTDFFVYLDSLMLKKAKNRRDARIQHFKPPKPPFLYKGHQIFFTPECLPYMGLCSCQILEHFNHSLQIRFEQMCQKREFPIFGGPFGGSVGVFGQN